MEQAQATLHRFHKNVDYYETHRAELLTQYPEQWVAIFNEAVVGADPDYEHLLDELKAQDLPLGKVFIQHATEKDELLILAV